MNGFLAKRGSALPILGALFLLLAARALAEDDCTALLKHGLYDYVSSISTNTSASNFQSNFCSTYQRYKSDQLSGSAAATYGVFSGSLSLSSSQVDAMGSMLCTSTASNASAAAALSNLSQVIDGNAVNAFTACVALNSPPDGLKVSANQDLTNPASYSLAVRYISPVGQNATATLGYIAYDQQQMTCTGDLITNKGPIDNSVRGLSCTRKLETTPVSYTYGGQPLQVYAPPTTVTITTSAGQFSQTLAPVVAVPLPPPSASVPLGSVISWFRFRSTDPIPDGYAIADGSVVNDGSSPFNGIATPNLSDRFVMGVPLARVSETGGSNTIPMDGAHTHSVSGTTDNPRSTNTDQWGFDGANKGKSPSATGLDHTHAFHGGTDTQGAHNHGGDKRPAYVGLLYLVRVR